MSTAAVPTDVRTPLEQSRIAMRNRNAICLCTDRNMLIPALFVADCVLRHGAGTRNPFDVIVFAEPSEVDDEHRAWMETRGIRIYDAFDGDLLRSAARFPERLSAATMIRLILPQILAGRYDRILYLDADLTIHGDVSAIFPLAMDGFPVAATPSGRRWLPWLAEEKAEFDRHTRLLGMSDPPRFFNAGVLLIDVGNWNRIDLGARTLDFIRRNSDLCYLPDEHGLNAVLDGRLVEISAVWNASPRNWSNPAMRRISEPVIVHYAGFDKPWKRYGYGKDLRRNLAVSGMYRSFLRDTPWSSWLDSQWTARDVGKNLLYEWRVMTKSLRGKPAVRMSRQQKLADVESFREFCLAARFADVEQGIVARVDGQLRLAHKAP